MRVTQIYENEGQLRQHNMVKHFLEQGIQTKINAVCLEMFVDGETLERSLECLQKVKNSTAENY